MGAPRWHERALCAASRRPDLWDEPGPGNQPRWAKWVGAVTLCQGCPVADLCAAEALDHGDRGVIRAGVIIPSATLSGRTLKAVRGALARVASGISPAAAVLDAYVRMRDYSEAYLPLVAVLNGDTPLPGVDTPVDETTPFPYPTITPTGGYGG